ncbi:hypothetical protein NBRC111893_210 [Lentilactobacillus kosonis]|uniref:Uncharacterized protein n=1 Tax=Lentilactobacillus kosonis TaxID=2810561 RepID=A0A401FI76_9LACO|nr:hypothetical protein NBRC111893_210 [Lentilactobacillus kosonis]
MTNSTTTTTTKTPETNMVFDDNVIAKSLVRPLVMLMEY